MLNHRMVLIISLIALTVITGCSTPSTTTTAIPTSITSSAPAFGTALPIEAVFGGGNAWASGITLSDVKFTYGPLDKDRASNTRLYKAGEPVIWFTAIATNNSDKNWYFGFITAEVVILDAYGIVGVSGCFIPAGSSQSLNVPMVFAPGLTKITFTGSVYAQQPP